MNLSLVASALSGCLFCLLAVSFAGENLRVFGGGPGVWLIHMLFFHAAALVGVAYARYLRRSLSAIGQSGVHSVLLLLSFAFIPFSMGEYWLSQGENTASALLEALALKTYVPAMTLAASPFVLDNLAAIRGESARPGILPAALIGAIVGLATAVPIAAYPMAVDGIRNLMVSALFICAAISTIAAAFRGADSAKRAAALGESKERALPSPLDRVFWIALPGCGSAVCVAATTRVSQAWLVHPSVWILGLGAYLFSWVIATTSAGKARQKVCVCLAWITFTAQAIILFFEYRAAIPNVIAIGASTLTILFCATLCHIELLSRSPRNKSADAFPIYIAAGVFIGSLTAAWLAPQTLGGTWEFHIALLAVTVVTGIARTERTGSLEDIANPSTGHKLWLAGVAALVVVCTLNINAYQRGVIHATRSFHGDTRVTEARLSAKIALHTLWNGSHRLGDQVVHHQYRRQAIAYHGPESGIALAFKYHPLQFARRRPGEPKLRVALLGVHTGAAAAYCSDEDTVRVYEENRAALDAAQFGFHHLRDTLAYIQFIPGNARTVMAAEMPKGFDLMVVEAARGGQAHTDWLTAEARAQFERHLKKDGVIAFHITHAALDFAPVLKGLYADSNPAPIRVRSPAQSNRFIHAADWILVGGNSDFQKRLLAAGGKSLTDMTEVVSLPWTDRTINLLKILK